ncbi:TMEM175 family protein [Empedobacter sp. GD03861]|uniref:TMEM175 family protein n=1 Tax=Empedobacter sp. GD03861 TaxID=2975390 RepID=UPI00244716D4|nr:TMEM175 family protein [Empedobacter sp. GD03861]MDH0674749.1 TMEM175 family protein [Empedobacter sp. GD03861]
MTTNRLEAFSDGVLAIIITIMVLDLKVPLGDDIMSLKPYIPKFLNYLFSFIYVGIYWNNHHHLFQAIEKVNGGILWSNLHLLFWLSLLPVSTGWMGENYDSTFPVAFYGFVLFMSSVAFMIIEKIAIKQEGKESVIGKSVSRSFKEISSSIGYLAGIGISFVKPEIGIVIYALIALLWLIPDRRIEKSMR